MELPLRSQTAPAGASASQIASVQPGTTAPGPQRMTRVLLIAAVLGICDQAYWQYSDVDHYFTGYWMPYVQGTAGAPEQYRIGVKMAAWWLVKHLRWEFRYGYTLMDLIASLAGVLLIYNLLLRRETIRKASAGLQWFASAGFVLLVGYYMAWVVFFMRPETLPSMGLTACMAWLWTRGETGRSNRALTVGGLLLAAGAQAWVRADLPCALNAGMFLVSLRASGSGLSLPRRAALATSAACIAVAAGTQLYIMRVLYPHASYGNIPVFMVTHDLHQPLTLPPFLIFMLPVVWTAVQAWRRWSAVDSGGRGLLLGAAIYLVLWILLGKLDEVRIFIPFAIALIPLTVDLAVRRASTGSAGVDRSACAAGA